MANESNAMRPASSEAESGVHRLRDIVVEEVSLVDRAANKRRFLVVKRSNQMADNGKPKDRSTPGDSASARAGGKKPKSTQEADVDKATPRATRAASEDEEDETETEKARRSSGSEEEDDETDTSKAADEEDDDGDDDDEDDEEDGEEEDDTDEEGEAKTGKTRTRSKAAARASGDARGGRSTQKANADEVVLPLATKNAVLRVLAQALERLMSVANQVKEAEAPDDEADASVPDDLTSELEDIGELLEDVGEQLADPSAKADDKKRGATKARAAKAGVAKAGRRMAKDRLERFQKALEALSSILKELVAAKTPQDPTAGATTNPLAKRNTAPGLSELTANVNELARVVKHQEDELVRLRKTPGMSNAIPVDGGGRRREVQDISWPLDMNRPISRDSVSKAVSFYDDKE